MDFIKNIEVEKLYPFGLAFILTVLLAVLGFSIYSLIKRNLQTVDYDQQLQELMSDENEYEYGSNSKNSKVKIGYLHKWNRYWGNIVKDAGISRYTGNEDSQLHMNAGRDIFVLMGITAFILSVLLRNPVFGILAAIAIPFVISFIMRYAINKKTSALNQQLPGFIFALKAQIQASETNENAMLKVVSAMPSPLFEELKVVENKLNAASTFKEAMEELSRRTSSPDLKFLAACMIQAAKSGANLENQLDSIQKVLESRRKVEDEINQAVQSATPAMWLSSLAIPGVFVASLMLDSSSREFWLTNPIAWVVLAGVLVLYGVSMFLVRNQVQKIKNI